MIVDFLEVDAIDGNSFFDLFLEELQPFVLSVTTHQTTSEFSQNAAKQQTYTVS